MATQSNLSDEMSTGGNQVDNSVEPIIAALYTELENLVPPDTFNRYEQTWNDGFYKGQLKAMELICMRLLGKSGSDLPTTDPKPSVGHSEAQS